MIRLGSCERGCERKAAKSLKYNRSQWCENGAFAVHTLCQCFQALKQFVANAVNGERSHVHTVNANGAKMAQGAVNQAKKRERKIVHTVNAAYLHPLTPRLFRAGGVSRICERKPEACVIFPQPQIGAKP